MRNIRTEFAAHQALCLAHATRNDWHAVLAARDARRVRPRIDRPALGFALLTALQTVGALFAVAALCAFV